MVYTMQILNSLINRLIKENILGLAYIEKPLNERYEDIHLHLLFNTDINVKRILEKIKSIIDELTYMSFYKIDDNILHYVSEDNLSLYVHADNLIYRFKKKVYLYDPYNVKDDETKLSLDNNEVINEMVRNINCFIDELHNIYQFEIGLENELSFLSLTKSIDFLYKFLGAYYLANPMNHSINDIYEVMEPGKCKELKKILAILSTHNLKECSKMLIWFIDEYISGLPISITQRIDVDYYMYVKKLIIGAK